MNMDIKCKICYLYENPVNNLIDFISPCGCNGSLKFVHSECLKMWRCSQKYTNMKKCIQCGCDYNIKNENSPSKTVVFIFTIFSVGISYYLTAFFVNNIFFPVFCYLIFDESVNRSIAILTFNKCYMGIFVYILIYKTIHYTHFFSIFNFIFTFWRILQFNFFIDKIFFWFMCVYYSYGILKFFNHRIDYMMYKSAKLL